MGGTTDAQGHEQKRLAALRACSILDTAEDSAFDRITEMAARLFAVPVAVISFVDHDRVWFKSHFGLSLEEIPRDSAFCARTIESDQVAVFPDTMGSVGGLRVRFYAGAPVVTPDGYRVGAMAIMDTRPRPELSSDERATLSDLAAIVTRELRRPDAESGDARFQALMESASQGIIAVDRQGHMEIVNHKAEELFGYAREEMIGRPLEMLLPEGLRASHVAHRQNYFGRPHPRPMGIGLELSGRRKNGDDFPLEISLNHIGMDGNALAIAFITDIGERLKLEAQLRQSQKMEAIGQLAGGVAHDFNNLLTIIQGYAAMSLEGIAPDDPSREALEEIEKAAVSAGGLTRQLLSFSRRQVIQLRRLNLSATIGQVEKMLRRVIGEDVELVLATAPNVHEISADPGLIEQILMNLAVNARDAMPNGGRLILETANLEIDREYAGAHLAVKTGPHAMLAVSDTGIGMTDEVRAHIFEPFFTTKPQGEGTGLGLATVYGIVKQLDGAIWVYSEPGHGTTFKILFPAAHSEETAPESAPTETAGEQGGERILLVEDEDSVRKYVRAMLERQGYSVLEAGGMTEALRIAVDASQKIDLLLTDIVMPKGNGPELASNFAELRPGVPVLFMSGYTDRTVRLQDEIDAAHFIQKPFTPSALAAKLREAIEKARQGGRPLQ
jgi:two-component system, cell cycle sensor histidine kinase and response regulator CckA